MLLISAHISLASVTHRWNQKVKTQIRLDRCVRKRAITLRNIITKIEWTNTQIKVLRNTIAVLYIEPRVRAALTLVVHATKTYQEAQKLIWTAQALQWWSQLGCGKKGDIPHPFPKFPFFRPSA